MRQGLRRVAQRECIIFSHAAPHNPLQLKPSLSRTSRKAKSGKGLAMTPVTRDNAFRGVGVDKSSAVA